jgi:class 3 adenylate cyclase
LSDERVERRLAAILAADVAGYSRLMGIDEKGTLAALKAHQRAVVEPKITEHRGRIVKTTGDGMLVEFASVVDAVRCAVDIQRQMAERNADVPAERRIEFRVGLNVGDIIIDGDDIFGDPGDVRVAPITALQRPPIRAATIFFKADFFNIIRRFQPLVRAGTGIQTADHWPTN